ncbi:MAG: glycosyltransferase [Rhodococcus sp. (in: high G+C Gram-positive bacteria)]|uniref:glycosyltransferase n=1 Tax=Rhodococcus sp. TaxID=1831 RepID=UPI002ADAA865|nr:glycosyltransferase [Rhodococcus sp. (in: high G+C Gram-positive bacteria)]MDZ7930482.1 glycosyltransferase [Rhodococcus sp. (in: high G+C Gram-positive bacteria)]
MKIAFAINGTRGDVQPAVVLAGALTERGHDVSVGVPPNLVDFARGCGLEASALGLDTRTQMKMVTEARAEAGRNPLRQIRAAAQLRDLGYSDLITDLGDVVAGADAIVTGFTTEQITLAYAERAGIPLISLHHAPLRRNTIHGPLPSLQLGGARTVRAQWWLLDRLFGLMTRRRDAHLRERLGCAPARRSPAAQLAAAPGIEIQAYDPLFAVRNDPVWDADTADRPRPVVGFLELPGQRRLGLAEMHSTEELSDWFDAGDPPVYVGFGSMPVRDPAKIVDAAVTASRRLGRRLLLCAGWNDLPTDSLAGEDIRVVGAVDHHAVFGRCAAIVHHGGAGTTAAAVRSGTPSVICWYGSDQPFWGREVERLGVGSTLPARQLDADRLTAALAQVLPLRETDATIGVATRLTTGDVALTRAVGEIETAVASPGRRHTR